MAGQAETSEVAAVRAELAVARQEAALKERQLERYATDIAETFRQERSAARDLAASYVATVRALANAVEARDAYTGKHAERVAAYGLEIARMGETRLAEDPQVEFGFLLHDVGKVAVPDAILFKPHPLSPDERALMERHPEVGYEILRDIDFLGEAKAVVRSHHERWDGRGYPDRTRGEDIPLAARFFAVADTLDALTTDRPYRRGKSFAVAREIIGQASGTQFDPAVAEIFLRIPEERLLQLQREHS